MSRLVETRLLERVNNLIPQLGELKGQVSDGYHTFDELYFHRMILFSVICKMHKGESWRSRLHADGTMYENYFIVGVNAPDGQYTYHYHESHWDHFDGVKVLDRAPEWDGHVPSDILKLNSLL
jgi:hypothetical protein